MTESSRTVACPYCATQYLLPETLLGAGGARVKCPNCQRLFVVSVTEEETVAPESTRVSPPAESPAGPEKPSAASPPATASAGASESPAAVAHDVLDAMVSGRDEQFQKASAAGRLFKMHGPEIIDAFESYKRRLGRSTDAAPFRDALKERWGVDMTPPEDPERSRG